MKMNRNIKTILTSIIVLMIILTTKVHAYSTDVVLSTDSKLEAGKDVEVTLKLENIDATATGISVVKGKITYDTDIFESYTLETKNGWTSQNENNTFLFEKETGITKKEEIATIKFKIKESITKDIAQIKFTNITASGIIKQNGGPGDIKVAGATIKVSKTQTAVITKEGLSTIGTSKTTESEIPFAGRRENIIIAIIGLSIFIIIVNKKYKNIDR